MNDFDAFKKEEEVYNHIPSYANTESIGFVSFISLAIVLIFLLV